MSPSRFERTGRALARSLTGLAVALSLSVFGVAEVAAQSTGTVTGLVRDAVSLSPLAGAQVSVQGTGIGGLANNVGRYLLLNVPTGQQTVSVTLIGYGTVTQTVTVAAGQSAALNFGLRQRALNLEGVVVTGTAGGAQRREIGNAVSQVSSADIEMAAVTDMSDVLQGRAAGVQITDMSGQVGGASQIRLRGNNSLTAGNNPLIYIDGVRMETNFIGTDDEAGQVPGVLDMINPDDIERIEIVKGPAATTLYGTEAAGGVIQIFTKRGSAGAPAWTFSTDQSMSRMAHIGGAANPKSINPTGLNLNDCSHEPGCPTSGTWFRNAHGQSYNMSVRGGGETATYFVSGKWGRQQGVVAPQGADDYSIRANISFQPFEGMDISLTNNYSHRLIQWIPDGNNASGFMLNVLRGDAGYTPGNDDSLLLENELFSDIDHFVVGVGAGWTPNAMFAHRLNAGLDYSLNDFTDFKAWGFYEIPTGDREDDQQQDRNLTLDYNGSFSYDLTGDMSSRFSWGGQLYEEFSWGLNGFDNTFAGPGEQLIGDGTQRDADEDRTRVRSGGFFLQEVLGWQDKFFVTGGVRWDGFSTFGEGFGLAAYPKISGSYLISDEAFFPATSVVENLKLRAAWGQSGKAPGVFDASRTYEATSADEEQPAVILDNIGNADLGPERTTELELGFETSLFEGRVSADFTWYDQTTEDALICVSFAASLGTEECVLDNLGAVDNWGTETSVNVVPVRTDNLEWAVGVNYSTNDSKITDLGDLPDLGTTRQLGLPLWIEWDDVLQNPGVTGERPEYEKAFIGRLFPTSTVGLSTRLTLNNSITLDLLGEGQYGLVRSSGPAYQNMRRVSASNPAWPYCTEIFARWEATSGGTDARIAASGLSAQELGECVRQFADQGVWTRKADFFRLRSATLAYRLPENLIPGTRSAQVSLQGKNLFIMTDYIGLDPEVNDNGASDSTPREYYNLPSPRIFIFNVSVNF